MRAFIEAHTVGISLSGHIHESAALETIDGTVCVNPGAFRGGNYATIEWPAEGTPAVEIRHL